ncbi:MAG TPA: class F sortase [Mycobacteriales bacterium]|nr:class F sortase [Mycobacteriales bacterium]
MAIGVVLLGNSVAVATRDPGRAAPAADATAVATVPIPAGPAVAPAPGRPRARLLPVQVAAPRVGIRAAVSRLGKAKDGTLQVPADFDLTGWYAAGPAPGEPGAAVVVGHVDSYTGPAVFFRLRRLRPGDRIDVRRTDGSVVQFTVQFTATYAKDSFPTGLVYQRTDEPTLRLVTCGGPFDRRAKSYRDNVVVFASASRVVPPPASAPGPD